MNLPFRDGDSKRKRNNITREMARSSRIRHVIDNVGHRLAGMPDGPPPSVATAVGPISLVPDDDQRWSFEFKDEGDIQQELAALQVAVELKYSAPAVMSRETFLLSPPSGTFAWLMHTEYGNCQKAPPPVERPSCRTTHRVWQLPERFPLLPNDRLIQRHTEYDNYQKGFPSCRTTV